MRGRDRGNERPARGSHHDVNRRTVAAIMGMAEGHDDEEGIIPDDAEEIDGVVGANGIKLSSDAVKTDKELEEPGLPNYGGAEGGKEELMSPAVALVAPDVTPHATDPLDPSQVPHAAVPPKQPEMPAAPGPEAAPASNINPLDVLMGRRSHSPEHMPPGPTARAESVPDASAAQAFVNSSLGMSMGGGGGLPDGPMPEHKEGNPKKIMEAVYRFGNISNTWTGR